MALVRATSAALLVFAIIAFSLGFHRSLKGATGASGGRGRHSGTQSAQTSDGVGVSAWVARTAGGYVVVCGPVTGSGPTPGLASGAIGPPLGDDIAFVMRLDGLHEGVGAPAVACTRLTASAGCIGYALEEVPSAGWTGPPPEPDRPPGTALTLVVRLEVLGTAGAREVAHEFVYFTADTPRPWAVERACRLHVTPVVAPSLSDPGAEAHRSTSAGGPRLALTATMGSMRHTIIQEWSEATDSWEPPLKLEGGCVVQFSQRPGGTRDGAIRVLRVDGVMADLSAVRCGPQPPSAEAKITGGSGWLKFVYGSEAAGGTGKAP